MNKSQGRVQAGSVPVRRGGRGGSLLQGGAVYYVYPSVRGDTLLRGVVYFVTAHVSDIAR